MPKVNVYLPDELLERVRRNKLPVSAICQAALGEAVAKVTATREAVAVSRPSLPEALDLPMPLGQHVHDAVALAYAAAVARGSAQVESQDLLRGILDQGESLLLLLLEQHGFSRQLLSAELDALPPGKRKGRQAAAPRMAKAARAILGRAAESARSDGAVAVTGRQLFLALSEDKDGAAGRLIVRLGIDRALTRAVFEATDAGAAFGAHAIALASKDDALTTLLADIRGRLDRIEKRLG